MKGDRRQETGKFGVVMVILVLTCIVNLMAFPDETAQVAFVFGKVEALRMEEGEWRFLKSGEVLRGEDIVRMPPGAILRLKDGQGVMLPVFTGSREQKVSELIALGKDKLQKLRGKRIVSNGMAAVDALPAGSYIPPDRRVSTEVYTGLSADQVDRLEERIKAIIPELREKTVKLIPTVDVKGGVYPPANLLQANLIFGILFDEGIYPRLAAQVKGILPERNENLEKLAVYRLLLGCVGIEAELKATRSGVAYLYFDSGLARDQISRITANKNLIVSNGRLMIPLWIRPDKPNFTYSWYQGARLVREESRL